MALFSKKEFAARCGMTTRALAVYVIRKRLIVTDGLIDEGVAMNGEFLERYQGKQKPVVAPGDLPAVKVKETKLKAATVKKPGKAGKIQPDPEKVATLYQLDKETKEVGIQKARGEIDILKMKRAKMQGQVIPTDVVRALFIQHAKSMTVAFEQGVDKILVNIAKKAKLGPNELAELRGKMIVVINEGVNKAVENSKSNIDNLVAEFSQLKSGE